MSKFRASAGVLGVGVHLQVGSFSRIISLYHSGCGILIVEGSAANSLLFYTFCGGKTMKTKICTNCRIEKEIGEFQANSRYKDGFSTWCKSCHKSASTKSRKVCAERDPDYHKNNALHKHGTNLEEYTERLSKQDGHCALCPAILSNNGDRLSIDHNHECCSGKYSCGKCSRGLLCSTCNSRLGYLEQLMKDFPFERRAQVEVSLRNSVSPDSWTYRALKYLKEYQ